MADTDTPMSLDLTAAMDRFSEIEKQFGADDTLDLPIEMLVRKAILAVGDVANEATWLTRKETVELLLTNLIKTRLADAFLKLDKVDA